MNGGDVLRDVEELRPRVTPFLEPGEQLQVVLRASSRPAKALKVLASQAWLVFHERDKFLLVATDRRWLVLESEQERFEGELRARGSFDRSTRIETSWLSRFDAFDQPYAIDPVYELWAVAANDALEAVEDGRPWELAECAGRLSAEDNDQLTEALGAVVMKVGRFIPRRRGSRP
jgi:hypothetical protein